MNNIVKIENKKFLFYNLYNCLYIYNEKVFSALNSIVLFELQIMNGLILEQIPSLSYDEYTYEYYMVYIYISI